MRFLLVVGITVIWELLLVWVGFGGWLEVELSVGNRRGFGLIVIFGFGGRGYGRIWGGLVYFFFFVFR